MSPELIVEVALRASLGPGTSPVLSYRVPPHLRELVQPGRLVWAPLRQRSVQGVVLRVASDQRPTRALRPLDGMGDPEASLTTSGMRLAEWVATTYRAPLYEVLALLLPPGTAQASETIWQATPAGIAADLASLPERERAVLYYLRLRGAQSERELRSVLRGTESDLRYVYYALAERGLLMREATRSTPGARPRFERMVALKLPPEQLAPTLASLARAPRQRAVVAWLAEQAAPEKTMPATLPVREVYAATGADAGLLRQLEQRGLVSLSQREVRRDPLAGLVVPPDQPPPLSPSQGAAHATLLTALERLRNTGDRTVSSPPPIFLLHGITGSGKTEIYLRAIARTMRLGRQALVLVPEIALTTQLVQRFAARFGGQLAVLHSGLAKGERYDEWRRLRRGEARLVIGSRSAVFAPLPELGLVIVDEEHELTYKHDAGPRYQARDTALQLARLAGAVSILGSATPSVESYAQALRGNYKLLELPERISGGIGVDGMPRSAPLPLPPVRLIDMRREIQAGNRAIFSRALHEALATTLARGEQALLFLNRRGAAAFVMCRDCGHVVGCQHCSGPMTVHYDDEEEHQPGQTNEQAGLLICHNCGARAPMPYLCPQCLSLRVRSFGVGTQRVAAEVATRFPQARILRWDRDTVGSKGAHGRMLEALLRREVDVLVGTQMIAKGLDLPLVALVGVVAADTGLHLPDFRSGERAFQLLTQVAGRAGRRSAGAKVIIQSYNPEHYALQAAQEHDYKGFYIQEIAYRRQTGYPPFGRLVRFVYASNSEHNARRTTEELAGRLNAELTTRRLEGWSLVGPAPAFIQRIRGRWRWHLILRTPPDTASSLTSLLEALGPLPGWIVDVDPAHVL